MTVEELVKLMRKAGESLGLVYQLWDSEWPLIWVYFREHGNDDTIRVGLDKYQCSVPDLDVPGTEMNVRECLRGQMRNYHPREEPTTLLCPQCARNADAGKPCWWCGHRN